MKQNSKGWKFHTSRTIALWKQKAKQSNLPVTEKTTVHISGHFAKILDDGFILVKVQKEDKKVQKFEIEFTKENLLAKIDLLSLKVGRFIHSGFVFRSASPFPILNKISQHLYQFRAQSRDYTKPLDISLVLKLQDQIHKDSPALAVSTLVESMLMTSAKLKGKEKETWLRKVEQLLRNTIANHSKSSELYALLAETIYLQNGDKKQVETFAREALKYDDYNDLAFLILTLQKGLNTNTGRTFYKQLEKVNPWSLPKSKNDQVMFQRGLFTKALLQKPKVAIVTTNNNQQKPDTAATLLLNEARILLKEGNQIAGFQLLDQVLKDYPKYEAAYVLKGKYYYQNKRYKESNQILVPAEKTFKDSSNFQHQIGENFYKLKNYAQAEKYFLNALSIDPASPLYMRRLSLALLRQKKAKEALQHLNTLTKVQPKNYSAWSLKGFAHASLKQWPNAVQSWKKSIKLGHRKAKSLQKHINYAKQKIK
ncbi:MAG: tetratricopeptide (TPR) repeat protein [bacterium]